MSGMNVGAPIPQWKQDLIARIRHKNRHSITNDQQQQLPRTSQRPEPVGHAVQQPNSSSFSSVAPGCSCEPVPTSSSASPNANDDTMVRERAWPPSSTERSDSDSSEDLSYGPGIVNRLKNRYLNLTLRESRPPRPSILRKATSLEDLLDDAPARPSRPYKTHDTARTTNRYRNNARGDLKRARSVETISRSSDTPELILAPPETVINARGSDNIQAHNGAPNTDKERRVNRPKRIAPVMSAKEKPPVDVVKQTKRLFEGRAVQRTRLPPHTGDVAAKIASFKSILNQSKPMIKPAIRQKPVIPSETTRAKKAPRESVVTNGNGEAKWPAKETSPDVARIASPAANEPDLSTSSTLSETPDLIVHSSPTRTISSPIFRILATDNFIRAEISHCSQEKKKVEHDEDVGDGKKRISVESRQNIRKAGNTFTFNLANGTGGRKVPGHLPQVHQGAKKVQHAVANGDGKSLTPLEIEKNFKNTVKTLEQQGVSNGVNKCVHQGLSIEVVPKGKTVPLGRDQNSVVFKFTDRKEVPDYVGNDGRIRSGKVERPKIGEGGIILLAGASLDESATDDDDEWMLSLEGPPSPCDVIFVNDNVLIDGRSSLSQRNKKSKLKIQFVESVPQIFEYPSEDSLLIEISSPTAMNSSAQTVPSLSGTTLSSYIPKSGLSNDEFQLGITKTIPEAKTIPVDIMTDELEEIEEAVVFSAGTNTDILF